MTCQKCARDVPQDATFCPYCGRRLSAAPTSRKKRGNGQGSVYRRGDRWCAAVTVGYYVAEDGKVRRKVRKKSGFERKKDALAYIETLRAQKERPKAVTFGQLWEMYQSKLSTLSKSKQQGYGIAWRRIAPEIQFRDVTEPTVPELQDLADRHGGTYYKTRDIKTVLSHLYDIALRDDLADKNRAQYIQLPPLEASERECFTEDEIAALWAASADSLVAVHMLIMLYTGIRPGELLTIRAENVHAAEHYMTGGIKTAKGRARKIILPDCILPLVARSIAASRDGLLASYGGRNAIYDAWNALRDRLGLRSCLTPYCCRHTYITRLTALKVSPAMLQELAGHEDYDTTLDYTHLSVADRLAEVNRLPHP